MANMPRGNQSGGIDLSPEETEVMKKCASTSIYTHSLPAMIASSAVVQFLRHRGVTVKFWATATSLLGAGILGRLCALPGCMQEVVTKYPDGTLARTIDDMRNKKQGIQGMDPFYREGFQQPDDRSGFEPYPKAPAPVGSSTQPPGQTYDDLRRRNRDQYIESRRPVQRPAATQPSPGEAPSSSSYSPEPSGTIFSSSLEPSGSTYYDPPSPYMDSRVSSSSSQEESTIIKRRKRLNKYGDEIED